MIDNDIEVGASPRIAVVFEGVLAKPLKNRISMYSYAKSGKWDGLAACWELQKTTLKSINQIAYRDNIPVDIYTFLYGQEFAEAIALRFARIDSSIGNVWYVTPEELSEAADTSPMLNRIYDSDQKRLASYGWRAMGVNFGGTIVY